MYGLVILVHRNVQLVNLMMDYKKQLCDPFLWTGSTVSRLEPLQGGILLFTTKFPEIPGTHFIDPGRMKAPHWVGYIQFHQGFEC